MVEGAAPSILQQVGLVAAIAAAIGSVITAAVGCILFWINRGRAESDTKHSADDAMAAAGRAQARADDAHERITIMDAAFGAFRERVASTYADKNSIDLVEVRLTRQLESIKASSTESMRGLHSRLDEIYRLLAGRAAPPPGP